MNDSVEPGPAEPVTGGLNILVVEDDESFGSALVRRMSEMEGAQVKWSRDLAQARQMLGSMPIDLVLADVRLPDGTGYSLMADRANALQSWLTVFLTGYGDVTSAVAAMKQGAFDFIEKPFSPDRLTDVVNRAAAYRREQVQAGELHDWLAQARGTQDTIAGKSAVIAALRQQVLQMARVPTDVLVIGETGSGKDLVTRRLHELSGRPGPFIALNCGAIPDTLFESELFGHQAGSFTGATKSTVGKIEQSNKGTLFLDEIESMPMNQQVKLLRVLETRKVERVGGSAEIDLDLRVVAASKERLEQRCKEGLFRIDLWHRLNVITIDIPPLRDRREDVPLLFSGYVSQACERFGIKEASLPGLSMASLMAYGWPGNVRELKHAAERFTLGMPPLPDQGMALSPTPDLGTQLGAFERELIRIALDRHDHDIGATAAELGVSEKTIARRMSEYGLARK
jgi:two-component system, response regulator AauR